MKKSAEMLQKTSDEQVRSTEKKLLAPGKQRVLELLGLICLFLALISLAVAITINFRPLYVFDINYLQILDWVDMSKETLLKNFDQLMAFLNNPFNQTLALPDFPMSAAGRGHFVDVKKLFLLDYGVLILTVVPAFLYLRHLKKSARLFKLVRPFQWGMGLPVILGAVMAIGFDTFFVKFHELFFANDDWLFDPATDPIINVLPESFFMHCFILAFLLIELFFLTMVIIGRRSLKK